MCHNIFKIGIDFVLGSSPPENEFYNGIDSLKKSILLSRGSFKVYKFGLSPVTSSLTCLAISQILFPSCP
jgi:hypothetical protein